LIPNGKRSMDARISKFNKLVLTLILFTAGAAAVYFFLGAREHVGLERTWVQEDRPPYFIEGAAATATEIASTEAQITGSRNNAIVRAARKVGSSVVSVSTIQVQIVRDPWFDLFYPFRRGIERKHYGLGSGFIIDKRGYVLTNQHVIEDADVIKATLANGEEFEAKIAGADYESDLAVLKIDANSDLPVAELGDSSELLVGEWAIAIGNPFGFLLKDSQPTVTVGVISAMGRSLQEDNRVFNNLIQTDASINPGNSGGPLVNCYGQVIGVNTAIFSTSGGSQGVGFAIPINTAKRVIDELIQYGMVIEPWVGIEYQELNEDIARHLGSPVSEGLLISDIAEGSPAQKAGLMRGDIVIKIGERSVHTLDEATEIDNLLRSGQDVTFRIIRNGEFQDISVKVEAAESAETAKAWFGLVVQAPTPEAAKKYGLSSYRKGVLVIRIDKDSPADRAELRRGDLILSMAKEQTDFFRNFGGDEGIEIKTIDDFRKFVSGIRRGQRIRIVFERKTQMWRTYLAAVRD
jgi:serine protease Do